MENTFFPECMPKSTLSGAAERKPKSGWYMLFPILSLLVCSCISNKSELQNSLWCNKLLTSGSLQFRSKCIFLGNENQITCSECEAVFPSVLPLTDAISVFPCKPSAKFLSHFSLSSSKWVHSLEKCERGCMSLARVQGVLAAMVGVIFSVVQCTFTDESICIIISNSFLWSSPISLWASHWKM